MPFELPLPKQLKAAAKYPENPVSSVEGAEDGYENGE
jgi:hypothetical protein